jgi:tRNA A37 threonylcarbamoyladenosine synthetase subunit TsaC/SUA5/YrdC
VIASTFDRRVELFLDAGQCGVQPSTVIDLTQDEPVLIRQGKGRI